MSERSDEPVSGLDILLRELAADPSAALLRMATRLPRRSPTEFADSISPRSAGLTLVERELLRSHREELGDLLRMAACELLLRDERTACNSTKYDEYHRPLRRVTEESIAGKARSLGHRGVLRGLDPVVRSMVEAIRHPGAWTKLEPRVIALASLRIRPCDRSRNVYVIALQARRELRPAMRVVASMLERSRAPLARSWAWGAKGLIELSQMQLEAALQSFREVLRSTPYTGPAAMNLLGTALRAGDRAACLEAATIIDTQFRDHPDEVRQNARDIRTRLRLNEVSVTFPRPQLLDPLQMPYGVLSLEVVRAFK